MSLIQLVLRWVQCNLAMTYTKACIAAQEDEVNQDHLMAQHHLTRLLNSKVFLPSTMISLKMLITLWQVTKSLEQIYLTIDLKTTSSSKTTSAVITKWANSITLATEWTQGIVSRTMAQEDSTMVTTDSITPISEQLKVFIKLNFETSEMNICWKKDWSWQDIFKIHFEKFYKNSKNIDQLKRTQTDMFPQIQS